MTRRIVFAVVATLALAAVDTLHAAPITDARSAVEAAKRYTRARCTDAAPCRYKAQHEGRQWRVWVRPVKPPPGVRRMRPDEGPALVLYFDVDGNLIRRLEAD